MSNNLFEDWLTNQSSEAIEQYVARQIPLVKGQSDNLKSAKVELTDRINNSGYQPQTLKVKGGIKTRPETHNPETIALVKAWGLAHINDSDFISKVANVAILKEATGKDEATLIEEGICCQSVEQYTFEVVKN